MSNGWRPRPAPGGLGIANSEAVEDAAKRDDTEHAPGSVMDHVLLHQSMIGQEARKRRELAGDYSDILVARHGGSSHFGSVAFPFLRDPPRPRTAERD